MKIDSDTIQKLLDGDLSADEQEEVRSRVMSDPAAKQEYEELRAALDLLELQGPREAPPGFTAAVMARLPEPALSNRVRMFLFGYRVLRWNMATALLLALVATAALVLVQRPDGPATTRPAAVGTVTVRLSFYAPQARQVAVAGDFNRWTVGRDLMDRRNGGLWTIDLTLHPGRYAYMFVLDGSTWVVDPGAESFQDDGFGSANAVMRIRT